MRYLFLIVLLFVSIETVLAQDNQLKFKHLTTENGLCNNWIRCIYKDDIGYMWFGTADGLSRYDGHLFKVYRPETNDGKSLGDINISDILQKGANELWVCTDLGVYIYNYSTDELQQFSLLKSLAVTSVLEDHEKKIWFGTNKGLYRFDPATKRITHYSFDPADSSSLSNSYINKLFEDSESNIWIGTKDGLNRYNKSRDSFIRFKPKDGPFRISTNDILSICEDHNKRIWIGLAQDGLFVFNYNSPDHVEFNKVIDGHIIKLLVDHRNILWIGKGSGEGLDRLKLDQFTYKKRPVLEHVQSNPQNISSLTDNSIYSLYEDDLNDIWIGTFGKGVNYFSSRAKKFNVVSARSDGKESIKNNLVNVIFEDKKFIYIGTEGGLELFDKNRGTYVHYQNKGNDTNSLSANPIFALCKDDRGNIWIGTWAGGLNLFNQQASLFKHFLPNNKPGSISSANVFSIFQDTRGNLWIGTIGGGLNRYNYDTGTFTVYKHTDSNQNSLYDDMVNCIYQTSSGRLYISTYNSLDLYDYQNDNFTHFVHDLNDAAGSFGNILSIFEDSRKNIWIATNSGLELFDEKTSSFTCYTTEHGLPDNTIQGILEDNSGNLWISTNYGLSKFINGVSKPNPPVFYNYTIDDGLSSNNFKKRSAFKNMQGVMSFGSSQGITYFNPDSIRMNMLPPQVILTGFYIMNLLPDKKHKNQELSRDLNLIDNMELAYRNADFVISFAALNYLNPQNNHFKYKLYGYDSLWKEADNKQTATYTNMNPGEYIFMVMASNNDGLWSKTPKTLKITIYPPWWKTMAFKIVVVILCIFLFIAILNARVRILKNQKRLLEDIVQKRTVELVALNKKLEDNQEEIVLQNEELSKHKDHLELLVKERTSEFLKAKEKAEESDRLKTAFLNNMSHEIRTPLNAIMGFSDILPENFDNKENLQNFSSIIKFKGNELLELVNSILDIANIESGQLSANLEKSNIKRLLEEMEIFFIEYQKRVNKENIQFIFKRQINNSDFEVFIDQGKLKQILINLIGNAFKFTSSGKIEVGCSLLEDNKLNFYISDTGIGIPKEKHEMIFERFRQIEEFAYHEGAGLGLSISQGLIHFLGGEIWLESEVNIGTIFHFTIPYIKDKVVSDRIKGQHFDLVDLKNKTIIIAEDDYNSFLYLKELFKDYNVNIVYAENGQVLMDMLESTQPDLILLDIKMPKKSGFECLKEIREKYLKTKIILQTAYAMDVEKEKCYEEGCNGYIVKPIQKDELFRVISKVLHNEL